MYILEYKSFYTQLQIGNGSFEIIESQNVYISGSINVNDNNNLITPEPLMECEVNIDNEWISDNEIYRTFSENNINFSNPYCTIHRILINEKGIVFYIFYIIYTTHSNTISLLHCL